MNQDEIKQLRSNTVADITEQLPALTDDELAAVLASEELDDTPRKTLLSAIKDEQASRTNSSGGEGGKGGASAAGNAAEPASARPKWMAEDYIGPLTCDQAQWRLANLGHHTKPAQADGVK